MRSVETLTKTPKKNVPTVTKPTEDAETVPSEQPQAPMAFDLSKVDPEILKTADKMGIPLGAIIQWANSVENRLQLMQDQMPQQIQQAMEQAIENARQKQIQQYRETVQQGGGSPTPGPGVMSLLGQLAPLLGGGGQDSEMVNLTKEMMKVNIESMKTDIGFSKAIKNALVAKITGKAIGSTAEKILG